MRKSIQLLMAVAVIPLSFSACKSKQKVVTIPNAHAEATAQTEAPSAPKEEPAAPVVSQPEEVRDEKFKLDTEEKDTKIMEQKYHVVVGSFKNRDNAKGLQRTLNTEGNNAVIVVNEHGMYRVLIASFPAYKDARTKISEVKKRFPDAWVLIQKEEK